MGFCWFSMVFHDIKIQMPVLKSRFMNRTLLAFALIGIVIGQMQAYANTARASIGANTASQKLITIGVQSCLGRDVAREKWQSTINHLNRQLPNHQFKLRIIDTPDDSLMYKMVEEGKLDYVISQPVATVELQAIHGVKPLLTYSNMAGWDQLGSVIFTSSNNPTISSIESLKGNSVAAATEKRLGGWVLALDYFYENDINPYQDFSEMRFLGNQDNIVRAVTNGVIDAGVVRTSVIEQLVRLDRLDPSEIKVLDQKSNFPHLISTPLVSEWSLGALKHMDPSLTQRVKALLLEFTYLNGNPRWVEAHDYKDVSNLLRKHRLGIYQDPVHVRFYKQNYQWVLIVLILAGYLIVLSKNRREREIQSYKAQLEQLSRVSSVDQLLSEVAHELSQPITSLKIDAHLLSDMLKDDDCQLDKIKSASKDLREKTDHCANLILNIRNFLSNKRISKEVFDINPHIERVTELVGRDLAKAKVNLSLELAPDLPKVEMSPVELDQVLLNLCQNAISAMRDNHKVRNELHIRTFGHNDSVLISLQDTGCLITNTEHLFELFHSTKQGSDTEGLGLGLNLSQRMIRSYGGDLSLQHTSPQGSTFLIKLPVKPYDA